MKRYRFVALISLWLAIAVIACQSEQVVETAAPVPDAPTPFPEVLQQLGVSEVVVDSMEAMNPGQELVLMDIAPLISTEKESGYTLLAVDSTVDSAVFQLPLIPQGSFVDVVGEGEPDSGVQIYALKVQDAMADTLPLSGEYAGLAIPPLAGLSLNFKGDHYADIASGWMLVWAANNQQLFPVGSGDDGLLFTDDDPMEPLAQGYTAMLFEDGELTRFRDTSLNVSFSTGQAPNKYDLSAMQPSDAYNEVISILQTNYPGWQEENRVYIEAIEHLSIVENDDTGESSLSHLASVMQDSLVTYQPQNNAKDWIAQYYPADYGFLAALIGDGTVRPYFLRLNGPAEKAGLEVGDRIVGVNGTSIETAIAGQDVPYFSTSNELLRQKLKVFYLFRGQSGDTLILDIRALDGEEKTITLQAQEYRKWISLGIADILGDAFGASLPVEVQYQDKMAVIKVNDFDSDPALTINMFVHALNRIQEKELDYLVLDYQRASGFNFLELAGHFTDQPLVLGELNCLEQFQQSVTVHPAEEQFEFKDIAVVTGPACSGACEMEVLAMQQLEDVTVYGMNATAGEFNIGYGGEIKLVNDSEINFPVCEFSSELLGEESVIVPDVKLPDSFYAIYHGNDYVISQAFGDMVIQKEMSSSPDLPLTAIDTFDVEEAYYLGSYPEFSLEGDLSELMKFHDIPHYDLYGTYESSQDWGAFFFILCSNTMLIQEKNMTYSDVTISIDGTELTDYYKASHHYFSSDYYGSYADRPCIGWLTGYNYLIAGHHEILITVDAERPLYFDDSYWDAGTYEFDIHLLVMADKEEVTLHEK